MLMLAGVKAQVLTGSTLYTNDDETLSFWQTITNLCGPHYTVPSLHASTTIYTSTAYTFQAGTQYTIQVTGYATAAGDLVNPGAATIYFGASLGPVQTTSDPNSACASFPNGASISGYAGTEVHGPLIDPLPKTVVNLETPFLTGPVGLYVGSFPNSTTPSVSTTATFTAPYTTNVLNIEVFPVAGDLPVTYAQNGCGGLSNAPTEATNTTLNITSINITSSCTPPSTPGISINGIEPLNHGTQMDVSVSTSAPAPYLWYVNGSLVYTAYSTSATINGGNNCNQTNTLTVQVSNGCGSNSTSTTYSRPCSSFASALAVSPNPAARAVTVSVIDNKEKQTNDNIYQVRIIDKLGIVRKIVRSPGGVKTMQVDIGSLSNDVYIVQVYDNGGWTSKRIMWAR